MKFKFVPVAAAAALIGGSASADPFVDKVVKNFQDLGYSYVEVERGPSQIKFEGVRGTEELEVVYDLQGNIIKQERDRADAEYIGRTGVEIGTSDEDFVGNDDDDEDDDQDDDDDGSRGDDDDEDDDDEDGSRGDDDDEDDDHSGSSNDDEDDDNSGSGSDDDHEDDDHSGSDDNDDDSGSDDSDDESDDDSDED